MTFGVRIASSMALALALAGGVMAVHERDALGQAGRRQPAWLGVELDTSHVEARGVRVRHAVRSSPGWAAGIRDGDVIVRVALESLSSVFKIEALHGKKIPQIFGGWNCWQEPVGGSPAIGHYADGVIHAFLSSKYIQACNGLISWHRLQRFERVAGIDRRHEIIRYELDAA